LLIASSYSFFLWVLTVIVGVAVVTVEVVVAYPNVRAGRAVAQGDAANATTETVDVVKQSQTLNYHGRPSTCF
jgi:hypothetical protein